MTDDAARRAALRTLTGALIRDVGGIEPAAIICGYGKGHLSEAVSPHQPDRAPRVDHVLLLEEAAGRRLVTEYLAGQHGMRLVPIARAEGCERGALFEAVGAIGQTVTLAVAAAADGDISPAERVALQAQIAVALAGLERAQALLGGLSSAPPAATPALRVAT